LPIIPVGFYTHWRPFLHQTDSVNALNSTGKYSKQEKPFRTYILSRSSKCLLRKVALHYSCQFFVASFLQLYRSNPVSNHPWKGHGHITQPIL